MSTESARGSTPELVAQQVGVRPVHLLESPRHGGLAVAKWRFTGFRALGERNPESILAYRIAGTAAVTKRVDGRALRKRPRVGSLTFMPSDGNATFTLDGPAEMLHLYLPPGQLENFTDDHLDGTRLARVNDFFAIEDPWLDGYFRMLASELEGTSGRPTDALLLDQTVHLVLRHLVRWHSDAGERARRALDQDARVSPLRPALLRRVEAYIDDHLARDIALAELAGLCCLSVDHFLRSYRAARGTTPYRYVIERRLHRAAEMLRASETPVAAVAVECGFRSQSHFATRFHAAYGVSPSRYRRSA
jgi:AraC family transcriptional regulator